MPEAYRFRAEFVWGHQSRIIGLSKSNPSYYYPPPTTVMGALAEVIAKDYGLGENPATTRKILSLLSHELLAIGVKPINTIPVKYMDINRIITVRKSGKGILPNPHDIAGSFDAPARGKTILVSLDDDHPPTLEYILIFRNTILRLRDKRIDIDKELFWEIHRIGSKESIVSVVSVDYSSDIEEKEGVIITKYSYPVTENIDTIEEISGRWVYEVYVNPYSIADSEPLINYYLRGENTILYKIPLMRIRNEYPQARVRVGGDMVAYNIVFKREKTILIGRRTPRG